MVKPGEKYRHYKGKVVEVVELVAMQTCGSRGDIVKCDDSPSSIAMVTDDFHPGETIVVYKEIGEAEWAKQWARPLRIFEEVLGETTMFYRFEKLVE